MNLRQLKVMFQNRCGPTRLDMSMSEMETHMPVRADIEKTHRDLEHLDRGPLAMSWAK